MLVSFLDLINNDAFLLSFFLLVLLFRLFLIHLLLHYYVDFLFAERNTILSSTSSC